MQRQPTTLTAFADEHDAALRMASRAGRRTARARCRRRRRTPEARVSQLGAVRSLSRATAAKKKGVSASAEKNLPHRPRNGVEHCAASLAAIAFYTILAAQFFSALADNALLFAAVAGFKDLGTRQAGRQPVLQCSSSSPTSCDCAVRRPLRVPRMPFPGASCHVHSGIRCSAASVAGHMGLWALARPLYSPGEVRHPHRSCATNWSGLTVGWKAYRGRDHPRSHPGGFLVGGKFLGLRRHSFRHLRHQQLGHVRTGLRIAGRARTLRRRSLGGTCTSALALDHKLPKKTPLYILRTSGIPDPALARSLGQVSLAVHHLVLGRGRQCWP